MDGLPKEDKEFETMDQPGRYTATPNYAPPYPNASYPPPKGGAPNNMVNGILKNPVYIGIGIGISVFLLWLGLLFQAIMIGSTDSGQMKTLMQISMILYNLGIAGLVMILFYIGLGRWEYPQWVRVVLILGAIILIVWGFMNLFSLFTMARLIGTGGGTTMLVSI